MAAQAKRKVKRASGLLRDAARDLAAAADGTDVVGTFVIRDSQDVQTVTAALQLELERRGPHEVVLIREPLKTHPQGPSRGEGEPA